MLNAVLFVAAAALANASSLAVPDGGVDRWVTREVPSAPPPITIEGVTQTENPETDPPLLFKRRLSADGRFDPPRTLDALVTEVWLGLSPDYRRDLAASFGFLGGRPEPPHNEESLRLYDLEMFLWEEFGLRDESDLLGRQIQCMSPGENSLTPLIALVVNREITSNEKDYLPWPNHSTKNPWLPFALAKRLAYACEQLSRSSEATGSGF